MIKMQKVQILKPDPRPDNTDPGTYMLWWDNTLNWSTYWNSNRWLNKYHVKTADMKYHATMAKKRECPFDKKKEQKR